MPDSKLPEISERDRIEIEAALFRKLITHLRKYPEVQNIDLMNLASLSPPRERKQLLSFVQTHSLKRGLKVFGKRGKEAAHKEMKQPHDRLCFKPIDVSTLTPLERKRAMESLMFLVEKKTGKWLFMLLI